MKIRQVDQDLRWNGDDWRVPLEREKRGAVATVDGLVLEFLRRANLLGEAPTLCGSLKPRAQQFSAPLVLASTLTERGRCIVLECIPEPQTPRVSMVEVKIRFLTPVSQSKGYLREIVRQINVEHESAQPTVSAAARSTEAFHDKRVRRVSSHVVGARA